MHLPGGPLRPSHLSVFSCLVLIFSSIGLIADWPAARAAATPHIFQRPALSKDLICFGYAGDLVDGAARRRQGDAAHHGSGH